MAMSAESREDFDTVTAWGQRLRDEGKSPAEILHAIYGVDLPREAYALDRALIAGQDMPLVVTVHPWSFLADAARDTDEEWSREVEDHAFARWPRFLPLLQLAAEDATHGNHVIGYDLDELAAGKRTIVGYDEDHPPEDGPLATLGPSLLAVMHEWMADHHRMLDEQLRAPANRGFGSISSREVEAAAAQLRAIEALQQADA
jgi:hypothetical protein